MTPNQYTALVEIDGFGRLDANRPMTFTPFRYVAGKKTVTEGVVEKLSHAGWLKGQIISELQIMFHVTDSGRQALVAHEAKVAAEKTRKRREQKRLTEVYGKRG